MTGRLARDWGLLLLLVGALQCTRGLEVCGEKEILCFSSQDDLKAAVDKVVAGTWSGDDISLWDVSGVDSM